MRYQEYSDYKDSGIDWLNEVPKHWELKRLGSKFNQRKEKVSDKDFEPLSVTKNGIFPQLANVAKSDASDNRKLVRKGDFVINSRSDRKGSSGLSDFDGSVSLINIVLEPNSTIDSNFCHHLLKSYLFQEEFYKYGHGIVADLWTTNYDDMKNIYLAIPPIDEQENIAIFLNKELIKIDNLISKQEQLIKLLDEQRKSIISHAVTKGLNPSAPMKDSGVEWLGEIPEHWELKPIKFIAKTNQYSLSEKTDPNLVIKYIDIGSVSYTNGVEKTETMLFSEAPSRARKIVHYGDIIVSTVRTYLKAIAYIDEGLDGMIASTGFAVITPNEKIINPHFAKYAFLSQAFIDEVIAKSKGISYPAINSTELINIKIPIPSLSEQNEIITFLSDESFKIDKLIVKEKLLIKKLQEYRSSIISHAVTGKIDVREAL